MSSFYSHNDALHGWGLREDGVRLGARTYILWVNTEEEVCSLSRNLQGYHITVSEA